MTARRINQILWTATACMGIAALACLLAGLLLPIDVENALKSGRANDISKNKPTTMSAITLAQYEPVWNASLRRPLADQPSAPTTEPVVAAATVPENNSPLTLVGTIGSSLAMLQSADGNVELKAVGESLGGMKVLAIRPSQVDVQYNGKKLTLDKVKPPAEQ